MEVGGATTWKGITTTLTDPPSGASWEEIGPLAISFDAYAYWHPARDVSATADEVWEAVAKGRENSL